MSPMQNRLTLVPAGAGSGKTYRIETELAQAVESGAIRPERILAVTFTEAAASDLRERIRGALLQRGRVEDALAIDAAYVGTIHALGLRLLAEHSFAAGRAPSGRLLADAERDLLIRQQLMRAPALAQVLSDLPRFGYVWDQNTGRSAEDQFRRAVLEVIDLLRSLGARGMSPDVVETAIADIRSVYGPTRDGEAMQRQLERAASDLLAVFPHGIAHTTEVATARRDFERDHDSLVASSAAGALDHDWVLWGKLGKLRCSNRNTKTPEGYDLLAERVIRAAEGLRHHPGPLKDAEDHVRSLVGGAQEIMTAYGEEKRARGLFDYADMIVECEELLRTRPDILEAVVGEIDCVVIDEFQDTNPAQFSLLWRLASRAPRALIVGDRKQAIMGFQGATPRLSVALDMAFPHSLDPLTANYRSVRPIMDFVNLVGPALFPEGYDPLTPVREATGDVALALLEITGRKDELFDVIASHVRELIDGGASIQDRTTKKMRPVVLSDVAVLTYTRIDAAKVAMSLRKAGLPVRLPEGGWHSSTVIQVARAALAFTADPADRLAALHLLSLGPDRAALESSLTLAMDDDLLSHPRLKLLAEFSDQACGMPVAKAVPAILALVGLEDWMSTLPDRPAAEANIGRLLHEAVAFDGAALSLRAAASFHGMSLQTFLGWLADQAERDQDHCPGADGWKVDGVEVCTWHASKGREWPVVIVAGFDKDICTRPRTMRAEFASFEDLDTVLDDAGISWFPDFTCAGLQEEFAARRVEDDEREAARAIYVAMTRARDRLVLAISPPPKKADPTARPKTMAALLRSRVGLVRGTDAMTVMDREVAAMCRLVAAAETPPVERVAPAEGEWSLPGRLEAVVPGERRPWRSSPSGLIAAPGSACPDLEHVDLGAACGGGDAFASAAERGTAHHLAFRVLAERPDLADRLPTATGLSEAALERIGRNVEAVKAWLAARGFAKLHFEVPLQLTGEDGSQHNAIIDLLAEGEESFMVVDHKTGPCLDPAFRFVGYHPQLLAYTEVLAQTHRHKPVAAVAIHWMDEGRLSLAAPVAEKCKDEAA